MEWKGIKQRIHSIKPADFEELVATLLTSFFKIPFVVARSGDQPSGDAISISGEVSMQAKLYKGKRTPNAKIVEGDIRQVIRELPHLQVYVLAVSRDAAQLRGTLDSVAEETGLDIVILELSDSLSDLGALCVTFWKRIYSFFDLSETAQEFSAWVQIAKDDSKTHDKMEDVRSKLEDGIQTQIHVQKDTEKYLLKRFNRDEGFNPINLSQAIDRDPLESKIADWWETEESPICCLEGKEGHGKTWLASKWMNSIHEKENTVTFWLDSKDWTGIKSISDLLRTCFSLIYPSHEHRKITKLQNKPAKIWRKTFIVLDGVNERNAIEAAQRILDEYFRPNSEWANRLCLLLTTRPLDNYQDFDIYPWIKCHKIQVGSFSDAELKEALTRKGLQPDDLPDSLKKEVARIPRYFQRCIELRDKLGSFGVVTKEMVLLADLSDKIKHSDQQIKQKLGWPRPEDPKDFFLHLAKQMKWDKIDAAPESLGQLLKECFSDYSKIRHDLEEQRIVSKAGLFDVKLSADHVLLCWVLYLSSLFESVESTKIEDLLERFQQELEPIPQEGVSTEALFAALQLSAISPNTDLSEEQRSQKRTALMLAWFKSHNAQITDERLLFWAEQDPDVYAQVVEFEFRHHNSPNYEDALIEPLAIAWLNKKGDLNRLASRLSNWLFPTHTDDLTENGDYINREGDPFPTMYYTRNRLSAAALSILSQRPERQLLATLARCHENSEGKVQFRDDIGRLMRWGYSEEVLGNLHWLAELAQHNERLLDGIYGLVANLALVDLPPLLQRPLSKKELETRAFVEQHNHRFKPYIDRIRSKERLLIGDSPADNVKGNYHGLDYLAVRTDVLCLTEHDKVEIEKVLHYISVNTQLGRGVGKTLEDYCIENLTPWFAKHSPESYAKIACDFKLNALNQEWAQFKLLSIQGLIFHPEDREKITEAIVGMKQRLVQGVQTGNSSSDAIYLTSLLTETLLFSASEEVLTDWFEFLASHELLRKSICDESLSYLLEQLLPKSIVELARQKLETLDLGTADDQSMSNEGSAKLPEQEYWRVLYAFGTQTDEALVTWALKELKLRKSDLTAGTFILMLSALSDPKRFLDEILNSKEIRKHLFHENSRRSIVPIYEGKDVPSYETLVPLVPPEIVGSFLCSPDRSDDLSRWGRELITRMCSILQGTVEDSNSVEKRRFEVNREVLRTWAEQDTTNFRQLANEYLTQLSKFPQYSQALSNFTDDIRCLLLRFQPDKAKQYYHQWNSESFKTIYRTRYGVTTLLAQLWKVEYCNLPEHRQLRQELLEECLNDEEIMFMTLAALSEGGRDELWSLVKEEYLESPYAKERNLGVSILPWFGTCEAINELKRLKSSDQSQWVREHAAWAYEVAQQERSCKEVYREALQTRDLFRISAVFEQIKPALLPTARWWHREIEKEEGFHEESQDIDPRLDALHYRFWDRWGDSIKTKGSIEVFERTLRDYCQGEKIPVNQVPRIAPWWKPASDSEG